MKKLSFITLLLLSLLLTACNSDTKEYVHVGPNWAALNAIQPSEKTFDVVVDLAGSAVLGDKLALKVKSEQAGKLWILQVDPNDQVSLVFPNAISKDNAITANDWKQIPAEGSNWSIEAMKPVGPSVIVFIVTSPNTDISAVFNGQANEMDKALRIVEDAAAWGLSKQVIDIKE